MEIPPAVPAYLRGRPHFYSSAPQVPAKGPAGKNAEYVMRYSEEKEKIVIDRLRFIGLTLINTDEHEF